MGRVVMKVVTVVNKEVSRGWRGSEGQHPVTVVIDVRQPVLRDRRDVAHDLKIHRGVRGLRNGVLHLAIGSGQHGSLVVLHERYGAMGRDWRVGRIAWIGGYR